MSPDETSGLRILSLEDSDLDAELIERELRSGGFEFVSCRVQTGEDFEREIIRFRPAIILADYLLPTFDGAQALALTQAKCPDVPVIVISGAVGEEIAVELLKNGATDFVLKDRLGRLVPAVHRALREVAQRNARRQAEADLLELNEQLEQRVAMRTHELGEKNVLMEEDLDMARELQMAFFPQHFPTLPRGVDPASSVVKFHSIYHPTHSVSGDYFNVVRVSDTAVGLFMCDVMGHGVRAALVTAMMRTLEEQLGDLAHDPGALLTEMNRALRGILRQLGTSLFTTACYIIVDVANKRLTFANAGHPSPLLARGAHGEIGSLTVARSAVPETESLSGPCTAGPALGLFEDVCYLSHQCPVAAGDLLLVFTDGLYEVENARAEVFGLERLREALRQRQGKPLEQLMQDVFGEIQGFAEGHTFADDVCLVGMEMQAVNGPGPMHPLG
jgi:sigma-B regulation protein RsbU (phosphoserine phosphatase)